LIHPSSKLATTRAWHITTLAEELGVQEASEDDLYELLDEERGRKRRALLEATEKELAKIAKEAARRTKKPLKETEIALKVGKVVGRYKMGKHFDCKIGEGSFQWARREHSIQQEAQLDGIYVLRTSDSRP